MLADDRNHDGSLGPDRWAASRTALPDELRWLAEAQSGVLSREQLAGGGLSHSFVRAQVAARRWARVRRGVYALFNGPLSRPARIWSALLAVGPGAVVSHRTAGELWGLVDAAEGPDAASRPDTADAADTADTADLPGAAEVVHVTVPTHRRVSSRPGVAVHYRDVPSVAAVGTIPVLPAADTVLDLVSGMTAARDVVALLTRACTSGATYRVELAVAVDARGRFRWHREVADVVADRKERDPLHRKRLPVAPIVQRYRYRVERGHGLPHAHRLPGWEKPTAVQWFDLFYDEHHTVVELDGRLSPTAGGKRRPLGIAEKHPLLYDWGDLLTDPCVIARTVAAHIGRFGWDGFVRECGHGCGVFTSDR